MNRLKRRVDSLEEARCGTRALIWVEYKDGGISCDGVFYPDGESLRQSLGLPERVMLIGWAKGIPDDGHNVAICRIPDNGQDILETEA